MHVHRKKVIPADASPLTEKLQAVLGFLDTLGGSEANADKQSESNQVVPVPTACD